MLRVDRVEEIDIAVQVELRIEREAREPEGADRADLGGEVQHGLLAGFRLVDDPDPAGPLPYENPAIARESQADGLVPSRAVRACDRGLGKARGKRGSQCGQLE